MYIFFASAIFTFFCYGDIWGDIDLYILPVEIIYVQLIFRIPGHITSTVYTPAENFRILINISLFFNPSFSNYHLLPAARGTFSSCRFLRSMIQQLLWASIRL
ncbi:hypothetical protein IW262DRAFT_917147 [Armillaria fumosa]|nr:hypothetical protein IW262DRAFT_917147 [Armillaria fumosa]